MDAFAQMDLHTQSEEDRFAYYVLKDARLLGRPCAQAAQFIWKDR